jgi:group I intron endonuclease
MNNRRNRCCGIYKISITNTNDFYIGLSKDIGGRWASHISLLLARYKSHHSKKMQFLHDELTLTMFNFSIIEICPEAELRTREKYWIHELKPTLNTLK